MTMGGSMSCTRKMYRRITPVDYCKVRAYDGPTSERCLSGFFQKYRHLCKAAAEKTDAFYFTPLKKTKPGEWFSRFPTGQNRLKSTVKRLCAAAGIQGQKTNHSLRATSATRLFRSGVSKQLICEQTGHCSEAVRMYKISSDEQKASVSDLLCVVSNKKKRQKLNKLKLLKQSRIVSKISLTVQNVMRKKYIVTINFN